MKKAITKELQNYSLAKLKDLSGNYGGNKTLHELVDNIFSEHHKKAEMNGYSTTQYSEIINHLNDEIGRNIMLNKILAIEQTPDRNDEMKIIHLKLNPQKTDIYNNIETSPVKKKDPAQEFYDDFDKLHQLLPDRYTYFLIHVKKDESGKVLSSHVMLVVTEIDPIRKRYNIYKYNSGFRDKEGEVKMDKHLIHFYREYQRKPGFKYNIIQTESWCPMSLQGKTNICGVYCFHIYHLLNKHPEISIKNIINESTREKVLPFLQKLASKIPGTSSQQMKLD